MPSPLPRSFLRRPAHWVAPWAVLSTAITAATACPAEAPATPGPDAVEGRWNELTHEPRYRHSAIYDPVRHRMLVFGGGYDYTLPTDVWSLSLTGTPTWRQLVPSGTTSPRIGNSAIYDPVRDRMIVFGGDGGSDVWALSLAGTPTWTLLAPNGTPPSPRNENSAIYDPIRDRMIVFGGTLQTQLNDAWELSLAGTPTWTQLAPMGTPPSPRHEHTAIYDPNGDRMVVFGGTSSFMLNDVWALSLSGTPTWTQLAPSGPLPPPRNGHVAIYDEAASRMIVYGGFSNGFVGDTWALSLQGALTWTEITPSGALPMARDEHSAIEDPINGRMVIFGGSAASPSLLADAWALSLSGTPAWTELTIIPPAPRESHCLIPDLARDRMVVFGGYDGTSYLNDVWALSLGSAAAWTPLVPGGTPPGPRKGGGAILDGARNRMLLFGGYDGSSYLNDVWALALTGAPAWTQLAASGTAPSIRSFASAIDDSVRDRLIVFGGYNGSSMNDTWALSLSGTPTWSELTPSGTPPTPRYGHSAIYDPLRDRIVVFGGTDGTRFNDVWALSLAGTPAWTQLTPSGTSPSPRSFPQAIYDPVRDRMLVFGGNNGSYMEGPFLNEVWALSLAGTPSWEQLAPSGSLPRPRSGAAIYDAGHDRMVIFAGSGFSSLLNDVWALECLGSVCEVGVSPQLPPTQERVWQAMPNPTHEGADVRLSIPAQATIRAGIYDVAGRCLRQVANGRFASGAHVLRWDGTSANSGRAAPGVYFWRISIDGHAFHRTSVVIP